MLDWLSGTGASAARSYWESGRAQALAAGQAPPEVSRPVGFTTFPDEIFRAPRSWVEQSYPNLTYLNEADRGGHFAAWEEPENLLHGGASRLQVTPLIGQHQRLTQTVRATRGTRGSWRGRKRFDAADLDSANHNGVLSEPPEAAMDQKDHTDGYEGVQPTVT